jgi:hypothetical protein
MGNETEKNQQNAGQGQQNPGQRQQNPGNVADPKQKNPSQSGDAYNPQDSTRKNPGQTGDNTDRKDREGSDEVEKRRAS